MKKIVRSIDTIFKNRVVTHVLFWLSFITLFTISATLNTGELKYNMYSYIALLPSQIIAAYLLNYFQIPRLLFKKKFIGFAISIVLSIYLLSAFGRWSIVYLAEPFIRSDFTQESIVEILSDTAYLFSIYFPSVYIYAFIMLIIKVLKRRFDEKQRIEILEKEKVVNELKFLKAQIQPHFLFNTLNNLYALTLLKSDLAPKVVLKLSELLDFILYQSDQTSIPLIQEIELINGFIELEALRYGDTLDIVFDHNLDDGKAQIAPLLLLPLVENAFKHGVSSDPIHTRILIDLSVSKRLLRFSVFNSKLKNLLKQKDYNKSGIGNINLRRQLEIYYPNKHNIEVKETSDSYFIELNLDLN
ncbi:sensor histidine kinase [Winogradskyella sp.]|uniref:sensor histidine kinase n=1 Tax=Winogradskyella sp. TaxID=1883156 RepID=UPI0026149FFF|nr:histidine kinase [Winogradskyella sp.]